MKSCWTHSAAALVVGLWLAEPTRAQTFTDLNFERAKLVSTTAQPEAGGPIVTNVKTSAALPGWTVKYDSTPISVIPGTSGFLDEMGVAMVPNTPSSQALDGNFSVELSGVLYPNQLSSFPSVASISQTGQIPAGTQSIEFLLLPYPGNRPTVTFAGNMISVVPWSESNGVLTMIGDVSAYAGTTGQLTFSAIPTQFLTGMTSGEKSNLFYLDDITFSTQSAPEPSSWALAAFAAVAFAIIRNRWNKREA